MGKDLKGRELGKGIRQRKDGRYEGRAIVNGCNIDVIDASLQTLKRIFESEKARVLRDEKSIRPNLTLKLWYEEWFEKCKSKQLKSDISRNTYNRKVKNTYVRLLGDKLIEDITPINIQDATNQLAQDEQYSVRGLKETVSILRECFNAAIANRIIYVNPVGAIVINETNEAPKDRRVLDHWEQDLFLKETSNSYYKEPYKVLLLTGMRIGEFSGLQWQDIDFAKKRIHISRSMMTAYQNGKKIMELTTPKTANAYRDIPFFGDVEQCFLDWKEKQDEYKKKLGDRWRTGDEFGDLVFTTTMGSPITRYNIVHDLKRVEQNIRLKEVDMAYMDGRQPRMFEHIHPHAFRHTFATRCFEKGLDPLVVQSIMGHANYSTTVSYTHVLDNKIDEAASKAGNLLD